MPSPSPFLLCIIFNVASLFVNLPHFTDGQQQQMLPMLANEPFPPSAAVAGGPPAAAPTEEQLISRLLKNPGLPPSGPPSMKNEAEKANAGNAIESGTTMGNNKAGENAVAAVAAGPGAVRSIHLFYILQYCISIPSTAKCRSISTAITHFLWPNSVHCCHSPTTIAFAAFTATRLYSMPDANPSTRM